MSDPSVPDLARDLGRLIKLMEESKAAIPVPFSPQEVERIKRAALLVERLDAAGWVGKWVLMTLGGAVALLSNWERLKDFLAGGTQ